MNSVPTSFKKPDHRIYFIHDMVTIILFFFMKAVMKKYLLVLLCFISGNADKILCTILQANYIFALMIN